MSTRQERTARAAQYSPDDIEVAKTAAYEIAAEALDLLRIPVTLRSSLLVPLIFKVTGAVLSCSDTELRGTLHWLECQIPTVERATGNFFRVGDKSHWSHGWRHHFAAQGGAEATPVEAEPDALDEEIVLRALNRATKGDFSTAKTTTAITNTICAWAKRNGFTAFKELSVPVVPLDGTAYGRYDLIVFRPGRPDLVIEIDSANTARSIRKLEFARDAGAATLWIRWNVGGLTEVPGVPTMDVRIKTLRAQNAA